MEVGVDGSNHSAHDPDDAHQTRESWKRKRDQGPVEESDLKNWSFARLKSHAINAERWKQRARKLRGTVDTLEGRLATTETEMRLPQSKLNDANSRASGAENQLAEVAGRLEKRNKIIEDVQKSLIPERETARRSSRSARTTKSASLATAGVPVPGPIRATEVSSSSGVARTSSRPPTSRPHPASSGDSALGVEPGVATAPQHPSTNKGSVPEVAPQIPPIKWMFNGALVDDPPPEAHAEGVVEMVTNIIKQGI